MRKDIILHLSALLILFLLEILGIFSEYHQGNFARILVLAAYGVGYNILFGYTGLLSLGHALFFSAGLYASGLSIYHLDYNIEQSLFLAICISALISLIIGFLALRTIGVSFMIVTLMFSQIAYLSILYFGSITRGDEGFVIQQAQRTIAGIDLTGDKARYMTALSLFTICFLSLAWIVQTPFGKTLIAIRENEDRARMLGYDTTAHKLKAIIVSGMVSGVAGASYAMLFGYVGATFASVQYSILPLLWVLLGGAGTTVGPLIGVLFMFYLIDFSSSITTAYLLVVGLVLVLLTMFAPKGICGELRKRLLPWLP